LTDVQRLLECLALMFYIENLEQNVILFLIIFPLTCISSEIGWQYHSQSKCNILFMAVIL